MSFSISRRGFLAGGVAAAVSGLGPQARAGARRRVAANDRIAIGFIGVGSLGGGHHLPRVLGMPDFEVLAVADPDRRHTASALERIAGSKKGGANATAYVDYRELLDRNDLDAVLISTPDHWHALNLIHACQAGKDVYCEKPLSLTIGEGRAMVEAARRAGRVVQVGTQQRSDRRFRQACELVRNGKIGKLKSVRCVLGRGPTEKRTADAAPPPELDWQLWLGPAPSVPFNERRCHYQFRWFFDYSGGKLTDWGAHHLDIAQWGLGHEDSGPVAVEGTGTFPSDNFFETPVDFEVRATYADGAELIATGAGENGVTFTGSDGEIFVSRGKITATNPELLKLEPGAVGPVVLHASADHHADFVRAVRERGRTASDIEVAHRSATVGHLGNLAIRLGRRLQWDPVVERFVGDDAANRLISKPMRHPWSL
ncbi:MAG: Gfo/Idh/MocA family oxidoreductase [Planctomycetes bacterium]|nr:Gfo/Idh/MocA family oxidoreductase [Planctomycetota bacterium]